MAKRVLVTGGAGLVGSHAAEYYCRKGYRVVVLDNLMRSRLFGSSRESVEYNWRYLAGLPGVERIKGDVRNEEDVKKALGLGVDVIIHTAGQPGVGFSINDPGEDFAINALGTLTVLECARKTCPEATFIYCSTNKVYGENVSGLPLRELKTRYAFEKIGGISEEMPVDRCGHTPYGVSKYAGDLYVQEYAHSYGMKTVVFRMSCIYGTRQFGFEDQGWVAWFIIAAMTGKPLTIYGDGKQVRDVLYVDDLIRAYDLAAESDLKSAVFNIGGGPKNTTSLLEFLDILEQEFKIKPEIGFSGWRASDQKVYVSDISRIKRELGWEPKVGFREGIGKLLGWIKDNQELFR